MSDLIDREQVKEHLIKACPMVQKKYLKDIIDGIPSVNVPSAEKTGEWIPVTERLPEEDKEVLISYRYKEGEGDTSHADIDITTYGQMYFGGNKVGNNKHWRAPFEYFHSNYEVIAWMPLPEPYKGQANCGARMEG